MGVGCQEDEMIRQRCWFRAREACNVLSFWAAVLSTHINHEQVVVSMSRIPKGFGKKSLGSSVLVAKSLRYY